MHKLTQELIDYFIDEIQNNKTVGMMLLFDILLANKNNEIIIKEFLGK